AGARDAARRRHRHDPGYHHALTPAADRAGSAARGSGTVLAWRRRRADFSRVAPEQFRARNVDPGLSED
ncbi:hypothetical protein, partial [Oharaeibacter diazotrophicus]|uniref:hypothetical protein n=1 Tax=Oharaeibacter diazotrophicus TaxID=1920512 RepID=UPI001A98392D